MLNHDFVITVQESTHVALARRVALEAARRAGLGDSDAGAVGIVVTEAGTNLLKHANGGEIVVRTRREAEHSVEILALDRGKGMSDIPRCSQDGYSTGGSPGTGLGAIGRLSAHHDIYSARDMGTVLLARFGPAATDGIFEAGAICAPAPGEEVSGDAWVLQSSPDRCRVVLADGLGHGPGAAEASQAAMRAALDNPSSPVVDFIDIAHARLRPTRGAALAIAEIRIEDRQVVFSGAGNVSGSILTGSQPRRHMVSMNGTAGHEIRTPREFHYPWEPGSLLILHSDGLTTHWTLDRYPGLLSRHPSLIASVLFRDFRRGRDDATVVVVRQVS